MVKIGRVQVQTRRLANRITSFARYRTDSCRSLAGSLPMKKEGVGSEGGLSSASFHTSLSPTPPPFDGFLLRQRNCILHIELKIFDENTVRKESGLAEPISFNKASDSSCHKSRNFRQLVSRLRKASRPRPNLN